MITCIDLAETVDFSSSLDAGETKTVFKISPLSSRIQARIGRLAREDGDGALEVMTEAFRFGVKNVVNLVKKGNIPVQFKSEEVSLGNDKYVVVAAEIIDSLPLNIVSEVGAKVISISNLSGEETKN